MSASLSISLCDCSKLFFSLIPLCKVGGRALFQKNILSQGNSPVIPVPLDQKFNILAVKYYFLKTFNLPVFTQVKLIFSLTFLWKNLLKLKYFLPFSPKELKRPKGRALDQTSNDTLHCSRPETMAIQLLSDKKKTKPYLSEIKIKLQDAVTGKTVHPRRTHKDHW